MKRQAGAGVNPGSPVLGDREVFRVFAWQCWKSLAWKGAGAWRQ
ncbi:hypothetical protein [Cyclobacterium xiamenense]